MASVLQVATIKDQGGNNNAIEIANSSANVTINNLAAGTIGSGVTFPSGKVTNVFNYWTTGTEYSNQSTTLKAMQTSNSISCISGRKYYIITTFNAWNYKDINLLEKLVKEGKTWIEIGEILNRTPNSCRRKYSYVFK